MGVIHNLNNLTPLRKKLRSEMTEPEWRLWYQIRNSLLGYKFRRQHSIGPYIVDFYCPKKKLIIEIDGGQHNEDKNIEQDLERTRYFNNLGIRVFRVWNNDMMQNLEGVIEELIRILNVSE
ncbi:hypothetical protein A3H03_02035 [Candidatus Kuenenbacteria bacterium RIFCSPLOWO2_12_FULL_42_13]|uniref:Primosomal protein N n=5 Tax=Candidatus Kueneniibacteriota TaxID=1752740 RepID=A0A0G0Z2S9_9BACT|nr:MAG: Primosomal protein N' [Candidatus Kuenenbacteria bacterium GW2011_GWA2_42_15]OGG89973.1 MAG: hypothetical protein A3C68_00825 [Candidatus Kuenenbacteria bacterium RIFCSPHIGHO2_02_FULL_42_29]OGG90734.1 MAG: hypothetical protein A3H55_00935 [Candidatus Kuenenbacteria bacterium RIFCSPLOWO2_02_FULL_42_16]OGG91753.1 MAG: hypothetical protein A3H03_02035 [Candidatus Kuenenbacteria bacterium RIFCSPLOWO2_12_FULL_42_13]OGG95998.1 MAG: hypothetical protein A2V95_01060 [Candidatus Kuenenbacteria b